MKFTEIIEACVGLRKAFERDEARFFLGLVEVEEKWMAVLKENGCDTFDNFIRSYELCRVERYAAFRAGLAMVTRADAESMGAPAVMALVKAAERKNVPAYVEAVKAWSDQHHGLTPRQETAERILRQVDPRRETPNAVRELNEMARLREELAAAKARIKELEREATKLRQTIAELRAKKRAA